MQIKLDVSEVKGCHKLTQPEKTKMLDLAGAFLINSTNVGYMKRVSPDGEKWAENAAWYAEMKGHSTPLTGHIGKTVHGSAGKYLEFATSNSQRMKNTLQSKLNLNKVTLSYKPTARKRANLTQFGGKSVMKLRNKKTGKDVNYNINVQARPHLGISTKYNRVGSKTDVQHIMKIVEHAVTGCYI